MSSTISKSAADLILREVIQNGETNLTLSTDKLGELLELTAQIAIDRAEKHPRPIEVANSRAATSLFAVCWRVMSSLRTTLGLLEEIPSGVDAEEWEGVTGSIHNAADSLELAAFMFDERHVASYAYQMREATRDA